MIGSSGKPDCPHVDNGSISVLPTPPDVGSQYGHGWYTALDRFAPHSTRRKALGGVIYFLGAPVSRGAVAFVDGQNLYHAAREAFGYRFPNYDPRALATAVCLSNGWDLRQTRFYTGIPGEADDPFWSIYWQNKLVQLNRQGTWTFSRPLRNRSRIVRFPDGAERSYETREEKGIDVRLALDVIRLAHRRELDVALIFSQDQDLSEVAVELRAIAKEQGRWLKVVSAYPLGPGSRNRRGINMTDWFRIDQETYDRCLDPRDYRPKAGNA